MNIDGVDVMNGSYIWVDDTRIYFEEAGDPDDTDIILIHTAGQDTLEWRFFTSKIILDEYHVIAVDLPGHGKSLPHKCGPINSIETYAEFVWEFVQKIGLENPVAIGTSIGGNIVLNMGVNHSNDMSAIISSEGAVYTPTYPEEFLNRMEHGNGIPGFENFMFHSTRHCHGSNALQSRVKEHIWTRRRAVTEIMHADLVAWNGQDLRHEVDKIECPIMVVYGTEDYYITESVLDDTKEYLKDAKIVEIEGIGHYPMLESDEFHAHTIEFLQDVGL